jgi:hypothetical protein
MTIEFSTTGSLAATAVLPALRAEEGGSGPCSPGAAASFIDALPGSPGLAGVNYSTSYEGGAGSGRILPLGRVEGRTVGVGQVLSDVRALGNATWAAALELAELDVEHRLKGDWICFRLALGCSATMKTPAPDCQP